MITSLKFDFDVSKNSVKHSVSEYERVCSDDKARSLHDKKVELTETIAVNRKQKKTFSSDRLRLCATLVHGFRPAFCSHPFSRFLFYFFLDVPRFVNAVHEN